MTTALTVPRRYQSGLAKIRDLGDESARELLISLQKMPPTINPESLSSAVADVMSDTIAASDVEEIVPALLFLYSLRDTASVSDIVVGIARGMEEVASNKLQSSPEDRGPFQARLAELLSIDSLDVIAKAGNLSQENEHSSRLRRRYEFKGDTAVEDFLKENPFLVRLLFDAYDRIREYFGPGTRLALEVISDPEAEEERELFLFIQTRLPPKAARTLLAVLDREWWLDAMLDAKGEMTISLEYV